MPALASRDRFRKKSGNTLLDEKEAFESIMNGGLSNFFFYYTSPCPPPPSPSARLNHLYAAEMLCICSFFVATCIDRCRHHTRAG